MFIFLSILHINNKEKFHYGSLKMRELIILLLLTDVAARRGGGSRGGSRGSSSRWSSSKGSWFSWGSRSRSHSYSTSSSTNRASYPTYSSSPTYQKDRQKQIARQNLAESYAYGGSNWNKLSHSKPKVPAVIPVVLTGHSHSHSNEHSNSEGSNSKKSLSKYLFGTSSFSVSLVSYDLTRPVCFRVGVHPGPLIKNF